MLVCNTKMQRTHCIAVIIHYNRKTIKNFKLSVDIDNLRSTEATIKELLRKRANEISERPRIKTQVIIKSFHKAMKDMFKEIESAQLRNPLLDYSSLINKLNDLLNHYRMLINTRATINKRKAAGLDNNDNTKADTAPTDPLVPDATDDPIEVGV